MPNPTIFTLVTFFHDLCTAIWIGGLVALGVSVLPSARAILGQSPETKRLMNRIQKRQRVLIYISMVGLLITGVLKARRNPMFTGLFSFSTTYDTALTLKHILILVMLVIALYRSLALGRQTAESSPAKEKLGAILLYLNLALGIVVLLLSGALVALAAAPPPA